MQSDTEDQENWDESLLGDALPDLECTEFQEDLGDEEDLDLANESALGLFTKFLVDAQVASQRAERLREKNGGRKRTRGHYTGHSKQTQWRNKKKAEKLKSQGVIGIADFLKIKAAGKLQKAQDNMDDTPVTHPSEENQNQEYIELGSSTENDSEEDSEKDQSQLSSSEPSQHIQPGETCMDPVNLAHVRLKEMLEAISNDTIPSDNSLESASESALNSLNYRNFPALQRAAASLELEAKNKKHDLLFRGRILAMFGTLTLYLDTSMGYSWRKASMVVAKSQGHGTHLARRIRDWLHTYLATKKLPLHKIGRYMSSLMDDEDFALAIKLPDALTAKKIPKGPSKEWGQSNRMRPGTLPDGTAQQLYWPDTHPTMPG